MVGWVDSFPDDLEAASVPVVVVWATAVFFMVGTAAFCCLHPELGVFSQGGV